MAPTVQSSSKDDRERRRGGERKSELVCKVKFNNTLPDIPFDPKFITYPFESHRFVQYNPTSLERSYKHELLTEHDLGITIDLINPDTYSIDPDGYLEVEDEKLLEEELATPQDSKRSRHHRINVSWLRKTEYISTEYNRFEQKSDKAESKVGFNIKKRFKEEDVYKDRESQIKAIEDTFDNAKTDIEKHYSKPGVTPVSVLPVYPDFEMWKHPCAQVIFDSDPAPKGRAVPAQVEEMSQAMIRGMVDESGDQFVAYFLPTEETIKKRKHDVEMEQEYDPEEIYDYTLAREYNWNVKNKASKGYEETYFFVFKDDGVYYNELETRVRLSKRRKLGGTGSAGASGVGAPTSNSRLLVKHRDLNDHELRSQDMRMTMLDLPGEEEEEEEEELNLSAAPMELGDEGLNKSDDENAGSGDEKDEVSRRSRSRSKSRSASRSRSRSGSRSRSVSRSRSRSKSGSRSPSPAKKRSRSKSGSRSRSRSRSRSASRSGSGNESEAEEAKKDVDEIFGSGSSDED